MTLRTVLTWPDRRLLQSAEPVEVVDGPIKALVADMFETMYHEKGVGLAATQLGIPLQVVVMDCGGREDRQPLTLINARIVERDGEVVWSEGCLSLPGITADVQRAQSVVVEALDAEGQPIRVEADGLLAVCIQHELDHLDGQLYVDRLGKLERRAALVDYERAREAREAPGQAQASAEEVR